MAAKPAAADRHYRAVAMTRVFDAPRERVFEAWTSAEQLSHWFAPEHFTVHSCEADPRPGGLFRLCMRSPQGQDYWVRGSYREVVAPERLVIACTADDELGIARLEEIIIVSFSDDRRGTRLELKADATGPSTRAAQMLGGMERGWAETIDRLADIL
jgi:uncharacterized protein YndB with AHSA1/START domain